MKRFLSILLCVLLVLSLIGQADTERETFRYTYIYAIRANLSISGTSATVSGQILPRTPLPTDITVSLQEYQSDGTWSTVASWSDSNPAGESQAGGTVSVSSTSTYRAYVVGHVYDSDGILLETATKYKP